MSCAHKRPSLALALLATTMLTQPAPLRAAPGDAIGREFRVNTNTVNDQRWPAVATDADGDFVVVWNMSLDDIFAQRFNAAGVAQGVEFQVNDYTTNQQREPSLAMDADGDFVAGWTSRNQDGSFGGVFAQRYDAAGNPRGDEFQANSYTIDAQALGGLAIDADGDFVLVWEGPGAGDDHGVFAQRYDGVERIEGDFDGDGNADVLWRHSGTGNTIVWLMDGTAKRAAQSIGAPPVVWRVVATGDFNGDGKADILWRHTDNGSTVVWQMDGFTKVAGGSIGKPPLVWEIEQVRDTNGDGISDIFWRNSTTGSTLVWQMLCFEKVATGGTGGVTAVWQVR